VAGGCLLLVVAAAACGGGDEETPSSTAGPSPVATVAPLPTIDPNVPLVEYSSPEIGYSVSYPEGWKADAAQGSTFATFNWSLEGGRPVAQLTVLCNRGENQTAESLMAQDTAILAQYGGAMPEESTTVEVGGVSGKQVTYTVNVSGFTIEQVAAYAVKGDCGWRIGLASYSPGSLQSYLPLFERILASFRAD